jgi:predicted alpha/beta-fold hydrolase
VKRTDRAFLSFVGVFIFIILHSGSYHGLETAQSVTRLWPEIEPYETGYLKVSKIHEIYYELCGSPDGKPVFFLHGGPGGSSSPYMRRFCDPAKFLMVLFDQRGSGKSKPLGEIKENTTQHLVEDIERLRKHLKLENDHSFRRILRIHTGIGLC